MLDQLEKVHLVIVDITGFNLNILDELGLRIGMEKLVIFIRDLIESNEEDFMNHKL